MTSHRPAALKDFEVPTRLEPQHATRIRLAMSTVRALRRQLAQASAHLKELVEEAAE